MYRKSKKLIVWCLVVSLVLTQMLFTNAAFAAGSSRLAGLNRYETALSVSQSGWAAGSTEYAVLAYGEDFPDALSAAPLAKKYNAPILLTDKAALSAGVLEEINRVGAKNVFIVGGEGVVSAAVADVLAAAGKTVTRLAGASRYETSLKVAEQIGATSTVVVTNGENYPDALSIAPIAAAKGWPILLTSPEAMDAAVKAYIGSKKAFVVGGVGAVSDAVLNGLTGAERVFGADRYATNVAVMTKFAADLSFNKVFLATGENFADALAGAAYAAKLSSPIVLVGDSMAAATESFIDTKVTSATEVIALGGTAVVPESAITAVGGGTQDLAISDIAVTTRDGRNVRITFNRPVTEIKASDITIVNKVNQSTIGVESTAMSSDNMSVAVKLQEEAEDYAGAGYIKTLDTYTFTVRAEGRTLAVDYTRPGFDEIRVIDVDAADRIISGDTSYEEYDVEFKVPADVVMDFAQVMGRKLSVWYNEDREITKFAVQEEAVKFDAVELDPDASSDQIKLITEDKKYDVAKVLSDDSDGVYDLTKYFHIYTNGDPNSLADIDDEIGDGNKVKYDYAKVVFDKNGDVVFLDTADWENFLVVEKVEGDIVYGYGEEVDTKDFAVQKDGKTIELKDLKEGDVLFYTDTFGPNDDEGFAEVFNKSVSGAIEDIYTDRITVAGKDHERAIADMGPNNDQVAKYINEDGDLKPLPTDETEFKDAMEAMQDAGDVSVFLNRYNKMVYLGGDIKDLVKTSSYNFLTAKPSEFDNRTKAYYRFDNLTSAGEEVKYDVAKSDVDGTADDDVLYTVDGETGTAAVWTPVDMVASNGTVTVPADNTLAKFDVAKVKVDKDGDLAEVDMLKRHYEAYASGDHFKTSDKYYDGMKIEDSAPVYIVDKYVDSDDVDDIDVMKYSELDFDYIDEVIFYEDVENNKIVAMVVYASDKDDDTTTYATMVTDDIAKKAGDDTIYKVPVIIDGKKVNLYTEKDPSILGTGGENITKFGDKTLVEIELTDKGNEITTITVITSGVRYDDGIVTKVNTVDKKVTIDATEYKLGPDAVIIDDTNKDAVVSLGTIKVGDTVKALKVKDSSVYINVLVRTKAK